MIRVNPSFEYSVKGDNEISVEINYRCYFSETHAFYPMNVMTGIWSGRILQDCIKEHKHSYEKDYLKVEVVDVFIDLPENEQQEQKLKQP